MGILRPALLLVSCALAAACAVAPAPPAATRHHAPPASDDPSETDAPPAPPPSSSSAPPSAARPGIDAFPGSKLFMPPKTPAPGIVMLHGSEGGSETYIQSFAADIAKQGFVVVTMCWFGCTGRPDKILRIPLESVVDLGNWLKTSPDVAGGKVGLFGWSRGAELSLLATSLAGTDPFRAVAAHAPSDTIVAAFDPATENTPPTYGGIDETDPKTGKTIPAPSWTWRGKDLYGEPSEDFQTPGPLIAVTSYAGPVYVSQGENDEVWPVARGRHVVAERNAVAGLVTESHFFPGEGHVLEQPGDVATWTAEIASFFQRRLE